jgi:hypothetical protein
MQYLLLMHSDPTGEPGTPGSGVALTEWIAEVRRRGAELPGARLRPPEEAVTVRVRDGEVLVSRGPYTETAEHIAGFDGLDVPDLDEAIELTALHPAARLGAIEIRPFWQP